MWAAHNGDAECLQLLLEYKANVNDQNEVRVCFCIPEGSEVSGGSPGGVHGADARDPQQPIARGVFPHSTTWMRRRNQAPGTRDRRSVGGDDGDAMV